MSRSAALSILLAIFSAEAFGQRADHAHEVHDELEDHAAHAEHDGHDGHDGYDREDARGAHDGHDGRGDRGELDGTDHEGHDAREGRDDHDGHAAGAAPGGFLDVPPQAPPPAAAFSGPAYAADVMFGAEEMAAAREQMRVEQGGFRTKMILADRFEAGFGDGDERFVWDAQGWYGGDLHKLWWKSEGAGQIGSNPDDAEVQVLYSRAVTPWFDFQAGVRHDYEPPPRRTHAVFGVQGLLPYVFEIDAAAFVSEDGDWTARFEAEYDLRLKQRLVLQPRIEMSFSAQAIPELEIGSGLGSVEGGLRLRYELRRELAPYIGLGWERNVGSTADFLRAAGEDPRGWKLIAGVRAWF